MKNRKLVMALGFFDGVHKGHMQLINQVLEIAEKSGGETALMTFSEHPLARIFPAYAPKLITNNTEKYNLINQAGISSIFMDDFTDELMKLSPEAFITDYLLKKHDVGHIVVGFNYTFGFQGAGQTQDLIQFGEKYGFGVTVVSPYLYDKTTVSSSLIRSLISSGNVAVLPDYLGRYYQISGKVVHGKHLANQYGIPTANLEIDGQKILPSSGVYYTQVSIDGEQFDGLTNLGFNPTFENHPYSIETYIYDFDGDLYGKTITLTFLSKERGEIRFESVDALIEHIKADIRHIDEKYRKSV